MEGLRATARIALLLVGLSAAVGSAFADGYEDGRAALVKGDYATVLKLWQPLAERGEPAGQNGMGLLYNQGYGVPQDIDKAIQWYHRAIDQGSIKAEYNLGKLYASDRWGRADPAEALRLLGAAAKHGFGPADFEIGEIYHDGRGVPRDSAKALSHYRVAAAQKFGLAQDAIGYMYMDGDGLPKDRIAAYAWFALAAANDGDPAQRIAQGDLEWITTQMSPSEISEAQQRAERCRQSDFRDCP